MLKKIIILVLLLSPGLYGTAQNPKPRDTSTIETKAVSEGSADMARSEQEQKKAEQKLEDDVEAAKEAKTERFKGRLFTGFGTIVLILIAVVLLRRKPGTK